MFCEQCLTLQHFPLFGLEWKELFTDKISQARNGVRIENFQRNQSKALTKKVDQLFYQGNPTSTNVKKVLLSVMDVKHKHMTSMLREGRRKLVNLLESSTEAQANEKWSLVLDDWRSSVAGAKALEARNCHLVSKLRVAQLGHVQYKKESSEWHQCYDELNLIIRNMRHTIYFLYNYRKN